MKFFKAAAVAASLAIPASGAAAQETFFTIGTGGQTGVYFVVGQSICRLVNRASAENGLKCTAPSTGGSTANINAIKAGDMQMGVAQSDWQYHAYNGTSEFEGNQFEGLRAVFGVHPEPFNVVARADAGIESLDDLAGKRVNIGNPGSGQRGTMEEVMAAKGWTKDDFALTSELKSSEQAQALCDNKIDAFVFTVGHPAGSLQEVFSTCEAKLVDISDDPVVQKLVEENPFYAMATIPGGTYAGNDEDVSTFGVRATFVTSTDVDDEIVYNVVKAVFDNFDRFKGLHPAFANLEPEDMISNGLSAPIHEGAKKYYVERGWMDSSS